MEEENTILVNDISKRVEIYKEYANKHKKIRSKYQFIYYVLGSLVLSMTITNSFLLGKVSLRDASDSYVLSSLIINIIVMVISSILNFLNIETKISRHNSSKLSYMDLVIDMERELLTIKNNTEDLNKLELVSREKEKMIHVNELNTDVFDSLCGCDRRI